MAVRRFHGYIAQLEEEYSRHKNMIKDIGMDNLRGQKDLRGYMCLRCAGFIERITYEAIDQFIDDHSGGPVLHFSKSWFKRSPNLDKSSLIQLISRFGEGEESKIKQFLDGEEGEILDDLSEVRNMVAHGRVQGGRKLHPERYIELSRLYSTWISDEFLDC